MGDEYKEKYTLQGYSDISIEEVERRMNYARMRSTELSVIKDELSLADKAGELCRIEVALSAFDAFLVDFVRLLKQIPDKVQSVVPSTNPAQYKEIQTYIEDALQRLSQKRLHLTIESTKVEKAENYSEVVESRKRSAKAKKAK